MGQLGTSFRMLVVGSAHSGMQLHSDTLPTSSWQLQLLGEKLWTVGSPGRDDRGGSWPHPDRCFEGVLRPGDALWYGPKWPHETEVLDHPTISISESGMPEDQERADLFAAVVWEDCAAFTLDLKTAPPTEEERPLLNGNVMSEDTCNAVARCWRPEIERAQARHPGWFIHPPVPEKGGKRKKKGRQKKAKKASGRKKGKGKNKKKQEL